MVLIAKETTFSVPINSLNEKVFSKDFFTQVKYLPVNDTVADTIQIKQDKKCFNIIFRDIISGCDSEDNLHVCLNKANLPKFNKDCRFIKKDKYWYLDDYNNENVFFKYDNVILEKKEHTVKNWKKGDEVKNSYYSSYYDYKVELYYNNIYDEKDINILKSLKLNNDWVSVIKIEKNEEDSYNFNIELYRIFNLF